MRLRALQVLFGQWMQARLLCHAERLDRRLEWWSSWTRARLP